MRDAAVAVQQCRERVEIRVAPASRPARGGSRPRGFGGGASDAGCSATSPGITTTETPRLPTASRIAISSTRGIWLALGDQLAIVAALLEQRSPDGSPGNSREPISADGMCAAIASTGTRERWQSNRPLMRCRLPGPQLPAQTASSPVRCASAPAAKAATSSCRTWTHSILPCRRIAVGEAVQAVADDAIDALDAGRGEGFGELISNVHGLAPGGEATHLLRTFSVNSVK